jgi:hypothetical protein
MQKNNSIETIRVASLNLCLQPPFLVNVGIFGCDRKNRRIDLATQFCLEHNVDIVILQEVWDSIWSSANIKNTRERFAKVGYKNVSYFPVKMPRATNTGMMILSKKEINFSAQHIFVNTGGLQSMVSNGVHYSLIGDLHIFATHIHAGPFDTSCRNDGEKCRKIQKAQITELKEIIAKNARDSRILVVGDFNSDAIGESISSRDLLPFPELVQTLGMGESLLQQIGYPSTYPFPNCGSYLVNPKFIGESTCVDHAFSTDNDCKTLVYPPAWEDEWFSDHAVVIIDMPK